MDIFVRADITNEDGVQLRPKVNGSTENQPDATQRLVWGDSH